MFPAKTYIQRRQALTKAIPSGILLFLGNEESPMNYADNTFHFRQDSTFLYFFGMDYAGLAAVIDVDNNQEILFGNDLTIEDIVWMGTQPTLLERGQAFGIGQIRPFNQLKDYLDQAGKKGRPVHFLPPYRPENKIKLMNLLGINPDEAGKKASTEMVKGVVNLRNHKTEEELAEIEKAVNSSVDMHITAMKMAQPGMSEAKLAAAVTEVALASGGQLSFPVIMTINGQTLHNHYHGNILKPGQLVLCDCGAETEMHYSGDLSSTFPVDKKFSGRQKEVYQLSYLAHQAALDTLAPGRPFREAHYAACRTIINGMKDLGLMKGDTEEALAAGAHALFFPCGTGHMMGLDVHDMEDLGEVWVGYAGEPKSTQFGLKSLRLARPMEPGFVATIEPGIYFIPELIDLWQKEGRNGHFLNFEKIGHFKNFSGVRNEENIVITADGYRIIGKRKPKSIEEVEALRQ
ncbi:MAG: Xaa-Pro aminopeptidase [Bacteroidetes bacterium GWF2_49_14]|nr:MAG: Xaa-Pro aminopeptidase [Bacteroidetes bacterium GWF2_49_14]HBB92725.1 Xaa-Pro aminopeptidase [Bacteroidales bacterium]